MEFLAHRGLWFNEEEKNTFSALCKSLDQGYGLETDVRDLNGELVISHDVPTKETVFPLDKLLNYYATHQHASTLALNVKSDGLQDLLLEQLSAHNIKNYFIFDMSVPDTLGYIKRGMRTFVRRSDLEEHKELLGMTQGVWLDELIKPWVDINTLNELKTQADSICLVSSELHLREHKPQWEIVAQALAQGSVPEQFMICTDLPQEAERVFK